LGDLDALRARGRRVLRVNFKELKGLESLIKELR
jgi:hypothetical protein